MLKATISMGVVRHFEDQDGGGCIVESTAALRQVRYAGDFGEGDYLIDIQHWLKPEMAPSKWPKPNMSSKYRYRTLEKFIRDHYGKLDVEAVMGIMGEHGKYWDGEQWQHVDGWSNPNTIDRLIKPFGTHTGHIAVPEEKTVYLRTGGSTALWGTLAPNLSGEFVKLVLEDNPAAVTATAESTARHELWVASKALMDSTNLPLIEKLNEAKIYYWHGLAYRAQAANQTGDKALKSYSKASSCFCKTQAYARQVKRVAEKP
jgi:hypothetical protein